MLNNYATVLGRTTYLQRLLGSILRNRKEYKHVMEEAGGEGFMLLQLQERFAGYAWTLLDPDLQQQGRFLRTLNLIGMSPGSLYFFHRSNSNEEIKGIRKQDLIFARNQLDKLSWEEALSTLAHQRKRLSKTGMLLHIVSTDKRKHNRVSKRVRTQAEWLDRLNPDRVVVVHGGKDLVLMWDNKVDFKQTKRLEEIYISNDNRRLI